MILRSVFASAGVANGSIVTVTACQHRHLRAYHRVLTFGTIPRPADGNNDALEPIHAAATAKQPRQRPYEGTGANRAPSNPRDKWRKRTERLASAFPPFSASTAQLQADIQSGKVNATQNLRRAIGHGNNNNHASLELIRASLQAEWLRVQSVPRRRRIAAIAPQENGLAKLILSHIWKHETLWVPLICCDPDSTTYLSYFAVAENLSDFITCWLSIDLPSDYHVHAPHVWRGMLFRKLVNAYLMLDTSSSATAALICWSQVINRKDEAYDKDTSSPMRFMSAWPVTVELSKALGSGNYHNTDPTLYDHFSKFYFRSSKDGLLTKKFISSVLNLRHPTHPTAEPAIDFLRPILSGKSSAEIAAASDAMPMNAGNLRNYLEAVRKDCLKSGRRQDAEWVAREGKKLLVAKDSS